MERKRRMAHRELLFAAVQKQNVCSVQTKERVRLVISFWKKHHEIKRKDMELDAFDK